MILGSLHESLYEPGKPQPAFSFFLRKALTAAAGQKRTQVGEEEVRPSFNDESSTGGKRCKKLLVEKYLSKIEQLTLILSFVIMFLSPMLIATSIISKNFLTALFGLFAFCLGEWFALSKCFKMVKRAEKGEVKR